MASTTADRLSVEKCPANFGRNLSFVGKFANAQYNLAAQRTALEEYDVSGAFDPAEAGWQPIHDRPGFVELIGPFWRRSAGNRTLYGLPVTEKHCNPNGVADDGVLSTLLDVSLGAACSDGQWGYKQATVSLSVQFIAPVQVGEFIIVEPDVVKAVPPIVFMQGTLRVDKSVRATAHGSWKLLDR